MKHSWLPVLIIILFLFSCSSDGEKSTTDADSSVKDSSTAIAVSNPDEIIDTAVQTYLRNFISDFESAKVSLPSVVYKEYFEYDANSYAYYFEGEKLLYLTVEIASEGGFMETLTIKREPSGDIVFKTSTEDAASFTCMNKGIRSGFIVTSRNEPLITGITEPYQDDYSAGIMQQFKVIADNKDKFKRKDGTYEFYLERKMVDSEYGKIEISKVYRIDERLFGVDLAKIVAKDFPDADLMKIFLGTWYPLYANKSGYERQSLCGHESKLIIAENEEKTTWYEQGLQDAWEGAIVGIQKKEKNIFEVELSSQGNNSKRILVMDESKNILFVNERPYTYYPDKYPVVDGGNDCQGEY